MTRALPSYGPFTVSQLTLVPLKEDRAADLRGRGDYGRTVAGQRGRGAVDRERAGEVGSAAIVEAARVAPDQGRRARSLLVGAGHLELEAGRGARGRHDRPAGRDHVA